MDAKTHWEKVYATKAPEALSWYRPHLETSLALIERAAAGFSASIIDVGGGESTLVDDLLARGYENITVLDVSQTPSTWPKSDSGSPQNRSIGSSPTSPMYSSNAALTMCGTTVRCFIFLLQAGTVLRIFDRSPTPSSLVAT